jgi:hypothetical protein
MGAARSLPWLCSGLLVACGGGSGGGGSSTPAPPPPPPPQAQFSLSTSALTFSAAEPKAAVPGSQSVTGTVAGTINGTTLYILVTATGDVVDAISTPFITGSSGSVSITPVAPMTLGTGSFSGTLTVRACVDSSTCATGELSGSPRTVNVTYTIGSSVQQDTVSPRVIERHAAGTVVVRGTGLTGVTSVSFGANFGNNVNVRNATELSVLHPPLPPGTYPISLNGGAVPFTAALVVAESPAFTQQLLAYPDQPADIAAMIYDAERRALLVVERYADPDLPDGTMTRILRYAFDGAAWGAPVAVSAPAVRDLAISHRGDRLLALAAAHLDELDPSTLALIVRTNNFDLIGTSAYMRYIALANDGHAVLSPDYFGSGGAPVYLYSMGTHSFTKIDYRRGSIVQGTNEHIGSTNGVVGASGDGSIALVAAGSSPLHYLPSSGMLLKAPFGGTSSGSEFRPSMDRGASRIVVSNGLETRVLNRDYTLFCTQPNEMRAYVVSPIGNRVFILTSASELRVFNLTVNPNGGPCSEEVPAVAVPNLGFDAPGYPIPRSTVRMAISPDSATLFFAGVNGILVKPWP